MDFISDVWNWTATYRDDGDLQMPYGWLEPIGKPFFYAPKGADLQKLWVERPYNEQEFLNSLSERPESFRKLAERPSEVAWAVSHCKTDAKREEYVEELQKYMKVSIVRQTRCSFIGRMHPLGTI